MRWSWAWTPFVAIGAAAIANTVMIIASRQVRPEQVEDNPFMASQKMDAHKRALVAFTDLGLSISPQPNDQGVVLQITNADGSTFATNIVNVRISAYRPDNASMDATTTWDNPQQSVALLLAPGPWRLGVTGTIGDTDVAWEDYISLSARSAPNLR